MTRRPPRPPSLARFLLRLARLGARRGEYESDLHELFHARQQTHGDRYARRRYLADVVSLILRPPRHPAIVRDLWRLDHLRLDIRYAGRLFFRQPFVILLAVGGMALALSINTMAFSVVDMLAFRPMQAIDTDSTAAIVRTAGESRSNWPYREYASLRDRIRLMALEAWIPEAVEVRAADFSVNETSVSVHFVTAGMFEAFDGRPAAGRLLRSADDDGNAPTVVVLQHAFWRTRFRSDPAVIGRTIYLAGEPATVVGVTSPAFTGPFHDPPALWIPFGSANAIYEYLGPFNAVTAAAVNVVGRVRAPATRGQAEAELDAVASGLQSQVDDAGTRGAAFAPLNPSRAERVAVALLVLATFALALILACANVASLLAASTAERRQEIVTRGALGASRGRLIRQLITEALVLTLVAGFAGWLLTIWLLPIAARWLPIPHGFAVSLDARAFAFSLFASIVAGVGAGLAPIQYLRGLGSPLRIARAARLRGTLIGVQAGASMLLMVLASLFVRAAWHAEVMEMGFDAAHLFEMRPSPSRTDSRAARADKFVAAAAGRIAKLPGIEAATRSMFTPFEGAFMPTELRLGQRSFRLVQNRIDANYFDTLRIPIAHGRAFTEDEVRSEAPVVILGGDAAQRLFGTVSPLGATVDLAVGRERRAVRIVGVAGAAAAGKPAFRRLGMVYAPLRASDSPRLLVRAHAGDDGGAAVHNAIRTLEPEMPMRATAVLELANREWAPLRVQAVVTGVLAMLAVTLAAVGMFGITTFVARQRFPEIGVRLALGATAWDIRRLLVSSSLRPAAIGLTIGLLGALAGGRVLTSLLYGLSPRDPPAVLAATLILMIATGAAAFVPARRAAAADPSRVLRQLRE